MDSKDSGACSPEELVWSLAQVWSLVWGEVSFEVMRTGCSSSAVCGVHLCSIKCTFSVVTVQAVFVARGVLR